MDKERRRVSYDIPARPTLYNGIRMRSRLEADFAGHLDRRGHEWSYEPECFASASGQWLPDFHATAPGGAGRYIEVKPSSFLRSDGTPLSGTVVAVPLGYALPADKINPVLRRMAIALETEPDAVIELVIWEYGATEPILSMMHFSWLPDIFPDGWAVRVPGIGIPLAWPWLAETGHYGA
jgi:hypothetical protein